MRLWWSLVDAEDFSVGVTGLAAWPEPLREWLFGAGLLAPAGPASRLRCPECLDHIEDVIVLDYPDGPRYFLPCPEHLRVEVRPEYLRRWTVDLQRLIVLLADGLNVTGRPRELIPTRLWRLGRTLWQGTVRDVFFGRCLGMEPIGHVRAATVRGRRPILLIPHLPPAKESWFGTAPPVISLAEHATLANGRLTVDPLAVAACLSATDSSSGDRKSVTTDRLKLIVRQQIKAEQKSELTDDLLVSAYRQCHSVRAAAEFLTAHLGRPVSKDQVHRALQRAGGPAAVLRTEDSGSVSRSVASQGCDSRRKIVASPQVEGRT